MVQTGGDPTESDRPAVDIEKLIGRLVLEHEMTKATALAERRRLLAEIERLTLKESVDK